MLLASSSSSALTSSRLARSFRRDFVLSYSIARPLTLSAFLRSSNNSRLATRDVASVLVRAITTLVRVNVEVGVIDIERLKSLIKGIVQVIFN